MTCLSPGCDHFLKSQPDSWTAHVLRPALRASSRAGLATQPPKSDHRVEGVRHHKGSNIHVYKPLTSKLENLEIKRMFLSSLAPTCPVSPRKPCPYSGLELVPHDLQWMFQQVFPPCWTTRLCALGFSCLGFSPGESFFTECSSQHWEGGELQIQGLLSSSSLSVKEKQTQVGATSPALLTAPGVYSLVHFSFSCITFLGAAWPSDLDKGQEAKAC